MKTIEKNTFYEIEIDEDKNRIYYKIIGYWANINKIPNYLTHIAEVLKYAKPGFTMVVDTTEMEPHPPEVEEIRKKAQIMAVNAGLKKAAEIVSKDFISTIQFDEMTSSTNFPKGKFGNKEAAEKWLDNQ